MDTDNAIYGEAVQIWYGDDIVVTDNTINGPGTFESCTYNRINAIGIVDYMSGFGAAGTITYSNNEVTNCYVGIGTFAGNGEISGNNISGNDIGIQVGQIDDVLINTPATGVAITGNDIENNIRGIWSQNFVPDGIAAHFNNIVGNTEYGIINEDQDDVFNATNNWWGNATGPYNTTTNPGGTGDNVSDNVTYKPWSHWKGQSEAETATGTVSGDSASFDATAKTNTEVDLSELGTGASGSITVAKYPATPSTATTLADDTGKTALKYADVQVGNLTQGNALIKVHYTDTGGLKESSLRLYYWDGSNWMESQSSSVDTTNNYVQGTIPVNKLTGTSVAAGGSPPPTQVPEFSPIGLLAFIGILSVVLAVATLRKRE